MFVFVVCYALAEADGFRRFLGGKRVWRRWRIDGILFILLDAFCQSIDHGTKVVGVHIADRTNA